MDLLSAVKHYLKVEHDADDHLLSQYITAAKSYIVNAIGRYTEGHAQFEVVLQMLVAHWYENRGVYESGTTGSSIPFTVEHLLTQLRYTSEGEQDHEEENQRTPAQTDLSKEGVDSG
ncbi:head-tail connector protein [Bacillus vallismortis]|uniref:head-tail connector protein n=1 Tax=Bacillus vallismortis TaxID=72361 RepID=UPI002090621C|nr:head-tail connector protein [Bacillus vallismortis]MCO4849974.1 head-tail connector protein [Bacillus vallismortis]